MSSHNIMAVLVDHRSKEAPKMQEIFTKHGCAIKMRLGLHETDDLCSEEGLILLHMGGSREDTKSLEADLNSLEGITAKTMTISSDE